MMSFLRTDRTTTPIFLQRALTDSLSSGIFIDTKIYGFSRRKSSGVVGDLKALYANSHVLKQVPYFDTLLSGGFLEGNTTDIRSDDKLLGGEDSWCGDSSDSDLEDDVPQESKNAHPPIRTQVMSGFPVSIDSGPFLSRSEPGYLSRTSQIDRSSNTSDPSQDEETDSSQSMKPRSLTPRPVHLGKVIIIKDAAFATLEALVMYLYTGEIGFALFGSEENRTSRRKLMASIPNYTVVPKASPKSIYRLAEKCDIPELRKLAYSHICSNLSRCDIVEESFSRFTSCYPEIRDAEVQQLARTFQGSNRFEVADQLEDKIQCYTEGKLPHASEVLSTLFDVLSEKVPPQAESVPGRPVLPTMNTSPNWLTLKAALNKSMMTGTFLDAMFYARSAFSPRLSLDFCRPVYFSKMAMNEWFDKIEKGTVRLDATTNPVAADEVDAIYEADSDSDFGDDEDFENASSPTGNIRQTILKSHHIPENPSFDNDAGAAAFFRLGAVSTWRALVFYMYTDHISFAPLSSQGREARITSIKAQHENFLYQPLSCSPKSLYALANELDLDPLRGLALQDIEGKISATNVVTELFSKFTSSQPAVLEMEDRILCEKYCNSDTTNIIKGHIQSLSEGENSYRSIALKFIFRRIAVGGHAAWHWELTF